MTVLLAFLVGAPPLLVLLMTGGADWMGAGDAPATEGGGLGLLLVPVSMLACLYAAQRLQLLLPAAAIRDTNMTPARSWAVTQGNGWRLLGGFALVHPAAGGADDRAHVGTRLGRGCNRQHRAGGVGPIWWRWPIRGCRRR